MEAKLKHLEFIQGVINRLADASFRIKRWAVFLVSALMVLLVRENDFAWIGFMPVLVFWGLDGYFLAQERRFRDLYNHVRKLDEKEIDFSMETKVTWRIWLDATLCKSKMLPPFYIALGIAVFVTILFS